MPLVTVILGVLLFPKALSALKCYECNPMGKGSCTETQWDCPASSSRESRQCGASTDITSAGVMDVYEKSKGCWLPAACGLSFSINTGISRTRFVSTCCSTALCNVQYPSPPNSSFLPNGKKCYTCLDDKDCSSILSCYGDEDRCVSMREYGGNEKMTMKGCISKSMCVLYRPTNTVSCCEGDLCNSATSTTISLLLLAAPLVSVALFN